MHARTGRVSFSPEKADDVIDRVREIVAQYEGQAGFKRFTLLIDRAKGEGLGISFWDSEDTMTAAEEVGNRAREGAAQSGSGRDQGAERFEVAIDTTA
jgi:heme-degrading monooxygenase HmoA